MAKIFSLNRKSIPALRERKATLLDQFRVPPSLLRASFVERFTTCGKANCRCRTGQKHGPFYYFTSCLARGRVQKFLLKGTEQRMAARIGIAQYRELGEQVEELAQINAELLRRGELLKDRR